MDPNFKKELRNRFKILVNKAETESIYSDFNYFSKNKLILNIDKTNTDIDRVESSGMKFRLFDLMKFTEFATNDFKENYIENNFNRLLNRAIENYKFNKANNLGFDIYFSNSNNINNDDNVDNSNNDSEDNKNNYLTKEFSSGKDINLNLKEITSKLNSIKNEFLNLDESIINVRTIFFKNIEENLFINYNKDLFQSILEYFFAVVIFVKSEDGNIRTIYESFVSNNYEDLFNKYYNKVEVIKKNINAIKIAKKLKGGKYKVILSPKLSGLLAHESFGHGMEADTMMKDRALASNYIGKKIGPENINIVDYPNIEGKHGHFYFDHEGNMATKTYLVKNGVINEPMGDLYSRNKLNLNNSSNSRFENFDHKNYVRMSNTYFEAGEDNLEDMIKSIDDGILIINTSGGMEDPKGWGVQIQGNFGQRIKDGKLIEEYYDGFALTGFLPDIIKNISAISKEVEIEGGGSCGKGHKEWVRVSEGGPYLKIDGVILG